MCSFRDRTRGWTGVRYRSGAVELKRMHEDMYRNSMHVKGWSLG